MIIKNSKLIVLLSLSALLFGACEKTESENSHLETSEIKKYTSSFEGKSSTITMLEFTSEQHFLSTVDSLNNLRETHIDNFMRPYENADDDFLFKIYEDTRFDDDLPLKQFEASLNFSSMRQVYQSLMDVWLSNVSLDTTNYPGDIYVFFPC